MKKIGILLLFIMFYTPMNSQDIFPLSINPGGNQYQLKLEKGKNNAGTTIIKICSSKVGKNCNKYPLSLPTNFKVSTFHSYALNLMESMAGTLGGSQKAQLKIDIYDIYVKYNQLSSLKQQQVALNLTSQKPAGVVLIPHVEVPLYVVENDKVTELNQLNNASEKYFVGEEGEMSDYEEKEKIHMELNSGVKTLKYVVEKLSNQIEKGEKVKKELETRIIATEENEGNADVQRRELDKHNNVLKEVKSKFATKERELKKTIDALDVAEEELLLASTIVESQTSKYSLEITNVGFEISDNFIDRITIEGVVYGEGSDGQKRMIKNHVTFENFRYRIPIKSRENRGMYAKVRSKTLSYTINPLGENIHLMLLIDDVFKYKLDTLGGARIPHVKDDEFNLKPGGSRVLYKKGVDQYIGITTSVGILHSAVDGDDDKENNDDGVLFTELSGKFPLNLYNNRKFHWFPSLETKIGFNVFNGARGAGNFHELENVLDANGNKTDSLYFDLFDLLRYRNAYFNLMANIVSFDVKAANVGIDFGVGMSAYRSGYKQTIISTNLDTIKEFNLFSYAPEVRLLFTWKPHSQLGVDLGFICTRLALINGDNRDPRVLESAGIYDTENFSQSTVYTPIKERSRYIGKIEFNGYFNPFGGQFKGGLFVKVENQFNFFESSNFSIIALAGFSTNLDAYINNQKKK